MSIYAVYLTTYHGNKLPMFYVGSSSVSKINDGYRGTVVSKKYKAVWLSELKDNQHLFKTKIVRTYNTRKEATEVECRLQKALNVVRSPMYINMATASGNGFFGMPTKGRVVSQETRDKLSKVHTGKTISESHRSAITEKLSGRVSNRKGVKMPPEYGEMQSKMKKGVPNLKLRGTVASAESKEKMSLAGKGRKKSQEHIDKIANKNKKKYRVTYPCGKVEVISGLTQFCRENDINLASLSDVVNGKRKSHKGFMAVRLYEESSFPLPLDDVDQLSLTCAVNQAVAIHPT